MTTKLVKWASEHGQMAKTRPSDGCGGNAVTTVTQLDYDRHGLDGYLGNVGSKELFTGDGVKGLQIPQP